MSNITKVLVALSIISFVIGIIMEINDQSGIQFTIACILFLIAAFINRSNDRKKSKNKKS